MFTRLSKLFRQTTLAPVSAATPLPYSRLTLDDWRSAPERVAYVQGLMADPMFRDLVGMLANVRPMQRGEITPTTASILLGQRTGYDQLIATLLAAGQQTPAPPTELVADYGAEGAVEAWEKEATE